MNDSHDLLGAYCTNSLDADERAQFETHLAACPQCQGEAAEFREVLAALADAHPVPPPESLEDAVVTRARAVRPHPATAIVPKLARRRATMWLAAAAAGALLFAGGFGLGRQQPPVAAGPDPAAYMAAVVAVASAPDAHAMPVEIMGTTSRVVMSEEMDKSVFLASALPMPAKGMVYQVWSVTADGRMSSAGAFTPDADGHVAVVLDCGGGPGVAKLMITMEPPGGSAHPTGEMLAEVAT